MDYYKFGEVFGGLIVFFMFAVPAVLFLLAQQNILKAILSENRELRPGLVWLQLIPVFNFYWSFVVVTRIADSISKEGVARQDDSILGIPDYDAVLALGKRPTYRIGIAWCILYSLWPLLAIFRRLINTVADPHLLFNMLFGLLALAIVTCWIIYWLKLVDERRFLRSLRP